LINFNSRKDKIDFLKGVIKGSNNVSELLSPPEMNVFYFDAKRKTYYCKKMEREFTEEEFAEYYKKRKKKYKDYVTEIIIHRTIIENSGTYEITSSLLS
jgi:hypothetical protein